MSAWRGRPPAASCDAHSAPGGSPLGLWHAIAIILGVAIGAGIFKAPSMVAAHVPSAGWLFAVWLAGGLFSIIGALCYAELSTTYPSQGGEYHFLSRAFGRATALLYAWARFSVITTGSIALLGFLFGDYMAQLLPLGPHGPAVYAAAAVLVLTALNVRGLREGARAQTWLTSLDVAGLALIVGAGAWLWLGGGTDALAATASAPSGPAAPPWAGGQGSNPSVPLSLAGIGMAMVFVLLTFGGWNDAAYISADLPHRRAIAWALLLSVGLITVLYLLVNWAYWATLGLDGMASADAVAAEMLAVSLGPVAGQLIALLVAVAALASMNATLIVGARTACAMGRDWPALRVLGAWCPERRVPRNSFVLQCALALVLIALGAVYDDGFTAMVEYTAPVFWLFLFLTGLALFRLRRLEPHVPRPFRVPLYPWVPLLFCASSLAMLGASLAFVGSHQVAGLNAAWVGVGVLASGLLLMRLMGRPAAPSQPLPRDTPP
ncbi:APC family permease [Xenophilus sp. Marseille-Q4582]|uniref:APC family permease n=1 Tax=Xenophilus sp. Marseille-Q4582 TaxID=2866600 RepID=UPI001CE3DF91|nr:amino acid permease [Xenophilus sp. Marseille-Q4582]